MQIYLSDIILQLQIKHNLIWKHMLQYGLWIRVIKQDIAGTTEILFLRQVAIAFRCTDSEIACGLAGEDSSTKHKKKNCCCAFTNDY